MIQMNSLFQVQFEIDQIDSLKTKIDYLPIHYLNLLANSLSKQYLNY